ncbi:XRE family transcriptional regulator [Apibacter muscae]|uniref:helix-turn-helix domain-containing protein n=1 Tax=Apibacter muscae TaxID=2509004 RepID=UPI0011AB9FAF|nr:helix-turn-helix transcriptional regulator [Apibacter muscae]TWP30213.1 XRE family transcriptional regulator [Apibacter muscae]
MKTGKIIANLRDSKNWSQTDLANHSGVSRVMIGKYERGEAIPSIDAAKKIADAFMVSLDFLMGEGINVSFDNKTVERLKEIELLDEEDKRCVYNLLDAFIAKNKLKAILG